MTLGIATTQVEAHKHQLVCLVVTVGCQFVIGSGYVNTVIKDKNTRKLRCGCVARIVDLRNNRFRIFANLLGDVVALL